LPERSLEHELYFESYGVTICFAANAPEAIEAVRVVLANHLPGSLEKSGEFETGHRFELIWNNADGDSLYQAAEPIFEREPRALALDIISSKIRLTVAEHNRSHVFVHSGAVSWNGVGIIFPGRSFTGKTALTAAMIERGAEYYSDEYAVFDDQGFLHSFPKTLSVRGEIDPYTQVDYSVESLGGTRATGKIRVALVVFAEYRTDAEWRPRRMIRAHGVINLLKHTSGIRQDPERILATLTKALDKAIVIKSRRGDADDAAGRIIDFLEVECR